MKKVFKFMMMALVAIVMSVGFAACSSDDDDNNKTPETPQKAKELYKQTIDLTFSEDLQTLFQPIMVGVSGHDSYQALDCLEQNAKNGQFKQELSYMYIPTVFSYMVDFTYYYGQESIAKLPEKESYDLTWTDNSIISAQYGNWSDTIKTTYGKANVKKSEIDSYIRENFYQKKFTVNIGEIIKKHEQK